MKLSQNQYRTVSISIIAISCILFSLTVKAQEAYYNQELEKLRQKKFIFKIEKFISKIEFLVGGSIIFPYGNDEIERERVTKFGFVAGVGFLHAINSRLAINLKFRYEEKGLKIIGYDLNAPPPGPIKFIRDYTENYVTTSLLPHYFPFKKYHLYIGVGPYLGYILSGYERIDLYQNGLVLAQSIAHRDVDKFDQRFDVGITGLIGYDLVLSKKIRSTFQFLYNRGFTDISQFMGYPVKNNTFSLLVGFSINNNR